MQVFLTFCNIQAQNKCHLLPVLSSFVPFLRGCSPQKNRHFQMNADFFVLQTFRGVILLDRLRLYDHGGVTAFDAARGRGDGAGDIAGGQEHRETDCQGGKQSQEDLFDVLFHCAEILVFLFCTDLTDFTDFFAHLHPCYPCYPYRLSWFVLYGYYEYYGYSCSTASVLSVQSVPIVVVCSVRILRILRIFLLEHGVSRSVTESHSSASV